MILARVIGNSVATVKHACFDGKSVLIVQPVRAEAKVPLERAS